MSTSKFLNCFLFSPRYAGTNLSHYILSTLLLTERAEPQVSLDYASPQQIRRQIEIASHLRDRVERFTTGDLSTEEFQSSCRTEAQSLALAMEGNLQAEFLLKAISSGLVSATTEYLVPAWAKPLLMGWVYGAFDATQNMKVVYALEKTIKQAVKATDVSSKDEESQKDDSEDCNQGHADAEVDALLLKLSVPKTLKLLWKFNANDITRTLKEACKRVLDDAADNQEMRLLRAKALNTLGWEFYAAVKIRRKTYGKGKEDYPDAETIQENVKTALLESVINEDFAE